MEKSTASASGGQNQRLEAEAETWQRQARATAERDAQRDDMVERRGRKPSQRGQRPPDRPQAKRTLNGMEKAMQGRRGRWWLRHTGSRRGGLADSCNKTNDRRPLAPFNPPSALCRPLRRERPAAAVRTERTQQRRSARREAKAKESAAAGTLQPHERGEKQRYKKRQLKRSCLWDRPLAGALRPPPGLLRRRPPRRRSGGRDQGAPHAGRGERRGGGGGGSRARKEERNALSRVAFSSMGALTLMLFLCLSPPPLSFAFGSALPLSLRCGCGCACVPSPCAPPAASPSPPFFWLSSMRSLAVLSSLSSPRAFVPAGTIVAGIGGCKGGAQVRNRHGT